MEEKTFDEILVDFRSKIKELAFEVKNTKEFKSNDDDTDGVEDVGEIIANLTLAYRHLEDASMRIGKTIQARNSGVSVFDNTAIGTPFK